MKKDKKHEPGLFELFSSIFKPKTPLETFNARIEAIENRMFEMDNQSRKTASDIVEYGRLSITADLLR